MRKTTASVVVLTASFALVGAACASNSSEGAGSTAAPTSASVAPTVETIDPGFITVGSCLDYAPFETVKGGEPVGFDIEMTDAIAAKLGYEGKVKWVKANFNTIFTAVANGQFDLVAAAVTATGDTGAERAQTVAFSNYYYDSLLSLSVNPTDSPDITSPDQLGSGDSVGVQKGSTGAQWAIDNLKPAGVEIRTFTSATDAFRDLSAGNVTGVINDQSSSYAIAESMTDVEVVAPIDTNEKYAFAFAPANTALVSAWNDGLQQVIDDGQYATIFDKYFPGTPVPEAYQAAA